MERFTKLLVLFTLIGILSGGCELLRNSVKWNEDYSSTFTINLTAGWTDASTRSSILTVYQSQSC